MQVVLWWVWNRTEGVLTLPGRNLDDRRGGKRGPLLRSLTHSIQLRHRLLNSILQLAVQFTTSKTIKHHCKTKALKQRIFLGKLNYFIKNQSFGYYLHLFNQRRFNTHRVSGKYWDMLINLKLTKISILNFH